MSLLEQEKATLAEKLGNTCKELEASNLDYDKLKREAIGKQEADRSAILNLQSELKGFREQFEETWYVKYLFIHLYYTLLGLL
jgi:hypothetical protein